MLELHDNSVAREAKPGLWIFRGKSVVLLVIGVGLAVVIFQILYARDLDWYLAVPISLLPLIIMSAAMVFFVNGRPQSYVNDLLLLGVWRFKTWLYLRGMKDRASELWIPDSATNHPKEF